MKYFKISEFECPCCGIAEMEFEFLRKLDLLREVFGSPLTVNSGYRCAKHNAELKNSSPNSQHMKGKAADLSTVGMSGPQKYRLVALAFEHGFTGIGIDKGFVHLDTRSENLSLWGY